MKNFIINITCCLLLAGSLSIEASAQSVRENRNKEKKAEVQKLIDAQNYVFKAQSATPLRGGRFIQLTSEYDVVVSKDKITSFLPYFGRAFTAPINPTEGGIRFTSEKFDYQVSKKKKGRQEIIIKPTDLLNPDVRQMVLNVSETGNATLSVTNNNRDPITFDGYITAAKEQN